MTKAEYEIAILKIELRFVAAHLDLATDSLITLGFDPNSEAVRITREVAEGARRLGRQEPG